MTVDDCVFCEIVQRRQFDFSDARVVSFVPLNPVIEGHRLFVPRHHVRDVGEMPYLTGAVFESAALYGQIEGRPFNLITSAGPAATQTVFHLHVHYVPRLPGDGLHLPWTTHD